MTNFKAFLPILIAILIALGGSYFLYNWVKGKTASQKQVIVKESKAFPVVIAKVPIPWGIKIIPEEMLITVPYLEKSLPQGYFSKISDLKDRVVTASLIEGDAVTEHRLAPITWEHGGMSAILKSGKRAISVQGNNVTGIAGFVNPGNRIDVLLTIKDPKKKKDITKIVLEDLNVLAAGRQIIENSAGEASPVDVYTLEVTPEQGERLTLAANKGRLQFALRGALDSDVVLTKGVTVPELLDAYVLHGKRPPVEIKPASTQGKKIAKSKVVRRSYTPPKKKKMSVEIIKGLNLSKKTVKI